LTGILRQQFGNGPPPFARWRFSPGNGTLTPVRKQISGRLAKQQQNPTGTVFRSLIKAMRI